MNYFEEVQTSSSNSGMILKLFETKLGIVSKRCILIFQRDDKSTIPRYRMEKQKTT